METSIERKGWRDESISRRHRLWGMGCPAIDLDFVMIECNYARPAAIVEYKHRHARPVDKEHASYKALADLCNRYTPNPLPCLVAIYDDRDWTFEVVPLNEAAARHYAHCAGERLTEKRFVTSLYLMRSRKLNDYDAGAIGQLNG